MWKGYKEAVHDMYEDIEICQTVNMKDIWKKDHQPDKRKAETICPNCNQKSYPLLIPLTVELERIRTKSKSSYRNRTDNIIYGVVCNKCQSKYKFKLICNSFHYAKLGMY